MLLSELYCKMKPKNKLKSFFTEHWNYLAVSTACRLNIFDRLQTPYTVKDLAKELCVAEDKLSLLLDSLLQNGFLDKEGMSFKNNLLSQYLTDDNPESLKYACLNWSNEHLTAWQNLDFTITTGKSSFESIYGMLFFDYLNNNPNKLHSYHKAMYQYARDDYKALTTLIHFGKHKSVIDIGGGYGAILEYILDKNPLIDCFLFDLENVLKNVLKNVTNPNIKKVSGSFFDKIPISAEAIILSRVLHDWNDEKSGVILKNSFQALLNNGTMYVIENCSDKIDINLSLLSLNMAVMCDSFERSSTEYISLAQTAGFHFVEAIKLNELQTILTFMK